MKDKEHGLRLIEGGGRSTSSASTEQALRLVTQPPSEPAVQLGLFGLSAIRRCLISVGLDGVERDVLFDILHREGVRHIVDIRVSPTFRTDVGRVLEQAITKRLASYVHVPLPFHPLLHRGAPEWELRARHVEELLSAHEILNTIIEKVDDGPVLLLSWTPSHVSSDRDLFVAALREVAKNDFTLIVR